MTDLPSPDDRLDEQISAALDDEATSDDLAAALDADPARAEAFRAVRDEIAAVPPAPAGLVDRQVAAALAAFDELGTASADVGDGDAAGATVVPLAPRRSRWLAAPLGAAAAVLVLALLVGGVLRAGDNDDAETDTAATATADEAADADDDGDDAAPLEDQSESSAGSAGDGAADVVLVAADFDELAVLVGARQAGAGEDGGLSAATTTAAPSATTTQDRVLAEDCDAVAATESADPIVDVIAAVVADADVIAVVTSSAEGPYLYVVDRATCSVVDERPL